MKLTKKEQEIYERCRGNCRICFNEGGCSLEKKLKKDIGLKKIFIQSKI